jgi:hypothetical protein
LTKKFKTYKTKLNELFNNGVDNDDDDTMKLFKRKLKLYISLTVERKKPKYGRNIQREYMEKVMMYGYVMVSYLPLAILIFF